MVLSKKQEEGLKLILERHKNKEKYTVISGYAGTGKSTLVKVAIEALDVEEDKVAYATYTGKAAEVLRKKGNDGACTLHKLLYDSIPLPGGGFYRKPKAKLEEEIIVVDEVSMVPKTMIDMLLKHRVYVIFLGDPFQLPQIDKNEENHLLDKPHVFLDEIMRQAKDSEIIRVTIDLRTTYDLNLFQGNDVQILPREALVTGMMTWADQIIVATNAMRQSVNNQMRELLGFSGLPQSGEKMICLRNYWDCCNVSNDALVNGTTGIIQNPFESFRRIPPYIKNDRRDLPVIIGDFIPDGSNEGFHSIEMDKDMIMTGEKCIDWRVAYQLGKMKNKIGDIIPKEFAFAYAITCHKAQGSEWPKILTIEERFPFDKVEHARWLYTAATRASSRLVLIRPQ